MYQPNYGYQYPYYGTQPPMPDNLAQLRMNANQMQNAVTIQPMPPQPMQHQSSQIIWVSGEAGAATYLVAPGTTVMLVAADNSVFYLKSGDASGMPLPLRVFDYKERTQNPSNLPVNAPKNDCEVNFDNFVTYDKLNEILASLPFNNAPKKVEKKPKGETDNG